MDPISARDTSRAVAQMFNLMDAWRHLPGYRLEGRLAPFFEYFLHDVLSEYLNGVELHPVVIPEFPLRIGTLYGEKKPTPVPAEHGRAPGANQSYNVDYVGFSMDRSTAFLVELKTDMSSIDDYQKDYLNAARNKQLGPFVEGIIEICKSKGTRKRSKYVHLLHLLAQLELVKITDQDKLYRHTFPAPRRGWTDAFGGVELTVDGKLEHTRVIYIQPHNANGESGKSEDDNNFQYIYFEDVAEVVQRYGDVGCAFAHYLRRWAEDPGRRYPRTATDPS